MGPAHPYVARSLNNLADLYRMQGRYAEAVPLYRRALEIVRKALEPAHPHVKALQYALADVEGKQHAEVEAHKAGKIRLTMAVVLSQAEGEALIARVESGEAFPGHDIGFVLPTDLDPPVSEIVKGLEPGQVSRVVETEKGYFIFKRPE